MVTTIAKRIAEELGEQARIRFAVLELLREEPRSWFQLGAAYDNVRRLNEWPYVSLGALLGVLNELLSEGRIFPTGATFYVGTDWAGRIHQPVYAVVRNGVES